MAEKVLLTKFMVRLFCQNLGIDSDTNITTIACKYLANRTYKEDELVDATFGLLVKYQEDYPSLEEYADLEIVRSNWKAVKELLLQESNSKYTEDRM
jgi:hypothetical protein